MHQYAGEHCKENYEGMTLEEIEMAATFYKRKTWRHIRESVLTRDEYLCQECKRIGKSTPAEHVHHIFPAAERPDLIFNMDNLVSLCKCCHNAMHERGTDTLTTKGEDLKRRTVRRVDARLLKK